MLTEVQETEDPKVDRGRWGAGYLARLSAVINEMTAGVPDAVRTGPRMAASDLSAKYAKSAIGIVWEFLEPLFLVAVFVGLHQTGAINVGDIQLPYALFVVSGVLFYQIVSDALLQGAETMRQHSSLLQRANVSAEMLIAATTCRVMFGAGIRVLAVILVALWLNKLTPLSALLYLAVGATTVVGITGAGLILGPFNCLYPDIAAGLRLLLRPLLFLSGALFPIANRGWVTEVSQLNPLTHIVAFSRSAFLATPLADQMTGLAALLVASAAVFVAGWYVTHVTIDIATERA